jgi:hypothetical protein
VQVAAGGEDDEVAHSEWRGAGGADPFAPPEWWPFDQPAWRGLIRTGPVAAVEGLLVGARSLASLLPAPAALDAVFQAAILLTLALMALVFLYNRPAWTVAPRLRALPGAIAEWTGVSAGSRYLAPQCDPCTTTTAASPTTSRSSRDGARSRPSPAGSAC